MLPRASDPANERVQQMFQRVLSHWAMDTLSLRRRGLDRPSSRECAGLALIRPEPASEPGRIYRPQEPVITWRDRRGKAA